MLFYKTVVCRTVINVIYKTVFVGQLSMLFYKTVVFRTVINVIYKTVIFRTVINVILQDGSL